jgi:hypothetical protein
VQPPAHHLQDRTRTRRARKAAQLLHVRAPLRPRLV